MVLHGSSRAGYLGCTSWSRSWSLPRSPRPLMSKQSQVFTRWCTWLVKVQQQQQLCDHVSTASCASTASAMACGPRKEDAQQHINAITAIFCTRSAARASRNGHASYVSPLRPFRNGCACYAMQYHNTSWAPLWASPRSPTCATCEQSYRGASTGTMIFSADQKCLRCNVCAHEAAPLRAPPLKMMTMPLEW